MDNKEGNKKNKNLNKETHTPNNIYEIIAAYRQATLHILTVNFNASKKAPPTLNETNPPSPHPLKLKIRRK